MKRPAPGTIQARVLELLKIGPVTLNNGCVALDLSEKQLRTAIDGLRLKNWPIVHCGPFEWRLSADCE